MAKMSKSSRRWLEEHFNDPYVELAQKEGFRSRAVYKLKEVDEKYRLIKPNMTVVDLGAAPGGWSQWAMKQVGHKGTVIASDILDMDAIAGVTFIKGDFREEEVLNEVLKQLGEDKADLVISDMAPNMSGTGAVDQPRAMFLVELALDMARQVLKPKGDFVVKLFQGEGSDAFLKDARTSFDKVMVRKPKSSRPRSREVYVVARGYKLV